MVIITYNVTIGNGKINSKRHPLFRLKLLDDVISILLAEHSIIHVRNVHFN